MDKLQKIKRLNIDNGKHVTVETHTVESEHPIHWHSFFEIEIILSGEGSYVLNDISYDISEYNMFFLSSTDFHYLKGRGLSISPSTKAPSTKRISGSLSRPKERGPIAFLRRRRKGLSPPPSF